MASLTWPKLMVTLAVAVAAPLLLGSVGLQQEGESPSVGDALPEESQPLTDLEEGTDPPTQPAPASISSCSITPARAREMIQPPPEGLPPARAALSGAGG